MGQTPDEITPHLAERLCWQVARRDDTRVARRLYRQQQVDGVYRLDEGAVVDEFFHFLQRIGVMVLLEQVHGVAIQRAMVPFVPYVLLYGLKTLFGIKSMKALPPLLFGDEAVMPWVGFKAQQVRQGICDRGAPKRQGERAPGPICPDTLAQQMVQGNLRDLAAVCKGSLRALAQAGVLGAKVTGMADGTDVEPTEHSGDGGQVTRQVRSEAKQGRVHEIEVSVDGWKVLLWIDAATKMPRAVTVGKIQEHETHGPRALVTQARAHRAGCARLHHVVFARGFWDGTDLWGLDQQGVNFGVPAKTTMAVTADARAQAMAGAGITRGHRGPTVRHGPGRTARRERLETEVVGITGLTTDDHYGPPEHGRQANRRDCQAHPRNAVVVRQGQGKDDGPGGQTVFLTKASVQHPLQPCEDDDDRRLMANCGIKEAKQQWDVGHPPQKTERAVRVHGLCTLLLFALATASRLLGAQEATGGEPVGWQRWRRQLLEQTRERGMVFAPGAYGIFPLAEDSLRVGGKRKDVPPGLGTRQDLLAKSRLTKHS